jgi:hypothetical protein
MNTKLINIQLKKETINRAFNHTAVHRRLFEQLERGHPYYDLMLEIRRNVNALYYSQRKRTLLNRLSIFIRKKLF